MILYLVIFIILMLFSFLELFRNLKARRPILVFTATILILFSGLRWKTGTDFNEYLHLFENSVSQIDNSTFESSYYYISNILNSYTLVLMFYSLFSIVFSFYFIKETKYPYSSIFLYYCFTFLSYNMGRMRQGLALSICMFSLIFLFKKKNIKFLITVLLAFFIHKSAIVFLLLFILYRIKFSKKLIISVSSITIIASLLHFDLIISKYIFNNSLLTSYSDYLDNSSNYVYFDFSILSLKRFIFLIVFTIFIDYSNPRNKLYVNSYFVGTIIYYLFKDFPVLSERLSYYYSCFEILLIPLLLSKLKGHIFGFIILISYGTYNFINVISISADDWFNKPYIPYHSVLEYKNIELGNIFGFIMLSLALFILIFVITKIDIKIKLNNKKANRLST